MFVVALAIVFLTNLLDPASRLTRVCLAQSTWRWRNRRPIIRSTTRLQARASLNIRRLLSAQNPRTLLPKSVTSADGSHGDNMALKTDDKKRKCKNCETKGTLKKEDKVVRCQRCGGSGIKR
jgi:hypothetical protein